MQKVSDELLKIDPKLINEFHSTQYHNEKWPRLLDRIHPLVNADFAGLAVIENLSDSGSELFHTFSTTSTNIDPVIEEEYLREYSHHESKHLELTMQSSVGQLTADPDFDDYDTIIQRPDVKFAMENMNIFHRVGVRLNDDRAYSDVIAFQLHADKRENLTQKDIAPIISYIPHMAHSINMGRIYDAIRKRYQAVLSMLDRVKIGMVLMNNAGSVVLANSYAREIIDSSKRLRFTKTGYLEATDSLMNMYLQSRLKLLHDLDDPLEKQIVRLGDDDDDSDLVLELSPLLDSDADVNKGFFGVMAMIVDPNRPFMANHESISTVYSLTNAEAEVAHLIVNGNNYNDIAERRGVTRETIKSQVGKLMSKMNVSTRAGVVRKMMNLSIPFYDGVNRTSRYIIDERASDNR